MGPESMFTAAIIAALVMKVTKKTSKMSPNVFILRYYGVIKDMREGSEEGDILERNEKKRKKKEKNAAIQFGDFRLFWFNRVKMEQFRIVTTDNKHYTQIRPVNRGVYRTIRHLVGKF
jgi:hypothetical protein